MKRKAASPAQKGVGRRKQAKNEETEWEKGKEKKPSSKEVKAEKRKRIEGDDEKIAPPKKKASTKVGEEKENRSSGSTHLTGGKKGDILVGTSAANHGVVIRYFVRIT